MGIQSSLLFKSVLIACLFLAGCDANSAPAGQVYWSDGDSGRIDGMKFRLSDVDAPETGGVGAAIGGAKCEAERKRGFEAKAFMVEMTRGQIVTVTTRYGADRYDRHVVDLAVNGSDLAQAGLAAGHLRPWPHEGNRALATRPDWCQ